MPLTPPPQAPSQADPDNFDNEAEAWVAWVGDTHIPELDELNDNVDAQAAQVALDRAATAASETSAAASAEAAEDSAAAAAASAASAIGGPGTSATSASSHSITEGSKAFVLEQTGKTLSVNQWVMAYRTSDPTKRVRGPITEVSNLASGPSPTVTVDVQLIDSSGGPYTDWTIVQVPEPLADIASQAEAEAGTANDVLMTPLRTAEAITELAPRWTKHGSTVTISTPVTDVSFTSLPSGAREYLVVGRNVSHNSASNQSLGVTSQTGGSTWGSFKRAITASFAAGSSRDFLVWVPLADQTTSELGYFAVANGDGVTGPTFDLGGPVTGVRIGLVSGSDSLDAGTIELWWR